MCAVEKCCWNMSSSSCAIRMVAGLQPHLFFNIEYIITKKMWILYKHRYLHGLYKRIIKTAFNKKKKISQFFNNEESTFQQYKQALNDLLLWVQSTKEVQIRCFYLISKVLHFVTSRTFFACPNSWIHLL